MGYLPLTGKDKEKMLADLKKSYAEELFSDIPTKVRLKGEIALPAPLSEIELKKELEALSRKNVTPGEYISFLGGGAY
jgi:glycine dehydrogenase subunit 1